jgi:hypothetical protein
LLVGAYASKVNFTDINGNGWTYSGYVLPFRLVPFSSRGPMLDGRVKPDITAPGLTLASSVSSYDTDYTPGGASSALVISSFHDVLSNKNYYYAEFSGTSASSPMAAGIVALLLQVNPYLTPAEVKELIRTTAITDQYTGVLSAQGNNDWGHGKINAYGAVKKLVQIVSVQHHTGEAVDLVLFPNPSNGLFTLDCAIDQSQELNIELYNMLGEKVIAESWKVNNGINRKTIDLSHQPKGNYVIKVSSDGGFTALKATVQ